jgi:hypothetical protein
MDLVRDVLDNLVLDRDGHEMGRVDGVVLEHTDGGPPRVIAIAVGPSVLGHRLHSLCGRLAEAVECLLGVRPVRPCQFLIEDVEEFGMTVKLKLAVDATTAGAVEDLIRAWLPRELRS